MPYYRCLQRMYRGGIPLKGVVTPDQNVYPIEKLKEIKRNSGGIDSKMKKLR